MNAARLWIALILVGSLVACSITSDNPLHISGHYGTIAYDGTVLHTTDGDKYVFVIRNLTLTFRPNAKTNAVSSLDRPKLGLLSSSGHARTSESWTVLNIRLDETHRSARVSNIRFVADKRTVDESMYTTLSITNGHLLWPLASQLKPNGKMIQSPTDDY